MFCFFERLVLQEDGGGGGGAAVAVLSFLLNEVLAKIVRTEIMFVAFCGGRRTL